MKTSRLRLPDDLLPRWTDAFKKNAPVWITGSAEGLPLSWPTGTPGEIDAMSNYNAVQEWVTAWRKWEDRCGGNAIVWTERYWKRMGRQPLPERVVCNSPEQLAGWLGAKLEFEKVKSRYSCLTGRWPALASCLPNEYRFLAECGDDELQRIVSTVSWLDANPSSGLYPRQIPIVGIHTKWLRIQWSRLNIWLHAIRGNLHGADLPREEKQFYLCAGLRPNPDMVTVRILDTELRRAVGGLSTFAAPVEDIAALSVSPCRILVAENLTTGWWLNDLPGTIAIIGRGNAVETLAGISWLQNTGIAYWGDIDTHGFKILGRFRTVFPNTVSLMMDMPTLSAYKEYCVKEDSPYSAAEIPGLNTAEASVYSYLKNHPGLRLEQERIGWEYAMDILRVWVGL